MPKEHFPYVAIVGVVAVVAVVVLLLSLRTTTQAPAAPVAEESAEEAVAGEAMNIGKLTKVKDIISTATKGKIKKPSTESGALCTNTVDDDGDGAKDWDDTDCRGTACQKMDGTNGIVVWSYLDWKEPSLVGIGCCNPTDCANSFYCTTQGGLSTPDVPQLFCASKNLWTFCHDRIINQVSEDGKYVCTLTQDGGYLWSSVSG